MLNSACNYTLYISGPSAVKARVVGLSPLLTDRYFSSPTT